MKADGAQTARGVLQFWGKAGDVDDDLAWHPVAFHSLDVAAVADAILEARPLTLARGACLLGLDPSIARQLLVMLIALHDLGKFGIAFQVKRPDLQPAVLGRVHDVPNTPHTS